MLTSSPGQASITEPVLGTVIAFHIAQLVEWRFLHLHTKFSKVVREGRNEGDEKRVDLAGASFVLADSALAALAAGSLPAAGPPPRRRWFRPLVLAQLAVVEAVVWGVAWAVFHGPEAFYPAMFVGGLLGAAVVARAVG